MASYAALVSLETTLEKYIPQDQLQILDDEDKRQSFIPQNVAFLLDFLDKFPRSARQLEKRIADSANRAECIIENHVWEARFNGEVSFHGSTKLFLDIKNIAAEIESIVREAEEIKSHAIAEDDSTSEGGPLSLRESGIRKNNDKVVGFDDELMRVKDVVFYNDSELLAIPIVGMGGVGKTTLARTAFDDPAVIRHFDVRRWVAISQIFDSRAILRAILGEESSNETASLQDLSVKVHHLLYKRRYFIVVDDIWSLDAWDGVKRYIPDDGNKSRVLLTTRDENVASYASGSSTVIHHLNPMDKEKSWRLLEQRVFGEGACCPPELVKLGETMAEGCKGLPLAIVVIAGILSNIEQTPDSWERIAEDVNVALSKGGEQISEILSLSYHHLPHFLKPCFLYLAAFPEDYHFDGIKLVKLWVADGFVKPKPTKLVEEIAYGCLEDLTKRNLIIVTLRRRYTGLIDRCQIHDLLRQLCIRQAEEEKFTYHIDDMSTLGIFMEDISDARRVSFGPDVSTEVMNLGQCSSSVRTAICFDPDQRLVTSLLRCRLLRALDISTDKSFDLPPELFQLYHLRYLELTLRFEASFKLPKDICNLENLESLIINPRLNNVVQDRVILPPEFWTMKNLRHVVIYPCVVLPDPTSQRFPLENLVTLSKLHNFRCTEGVVKLIPNVRKMGVFYELDYEKENWYDYDLNNFGRFINLEDLYVILESRGYELGWCERNPLLKCFLLPSSLRRLAITGSAARIPWDDLNAALGPLPNLECLKVLMFACSGDMWETREGNFQNLRYLLIGFADLKCWIIKSPSHFPNLENLMLCYCFKLNELSDCIGDIPTLQYIEIDNCPEAVADWGRRIEDEQRDMGNELLKIRIQQVDEHRVLKKEEKFAQQIGPFLKRMHLLKDKMEDVDQLVDTRDEKFYEDLAGIDQLSRLLTLDEENKISLVGISISTKAMEYYHSGDGNVIHFSDFIEELKSYLKVYEVLCVGDEDGVLSLNALSRLALLQEHSSSERRERRRRGETES